jgi:hypothetical protein
MLPKPLGVTPQEVRFAYMAERVGNGCEVPRSLRMGQRFVGKATRACDLA